MESEEQQGSDQMEDTHAGSTGASEDPQPQTDGGSQEGAGDGTDAQPAETTTVDEAVQAGAVDPGDLEGTPEGQGGNAQDPDGATETQDATSGGAETSEGGDAASGTEGGAGE